MGFYNVLEKLKIALKMMLFSSIWTSFYTLHINENQFGIVEIYLLPDKFDR